MSRKILIPLFILLIFVPMAADWKKEVVHFFRKTHEYDKIANFLEKKLGNIPANEEYQAVILLCYSFRELGDTVNEEKWISHYFENFEIKDPDLSFLAPKDGIKIYEYIETWKRKYPEIKLITVDKRSLKVNYYEPPEEFYLEMLISAPSAITITGPNRKSLYNGYLKQGGNTVPLPFEDFLRKQNHSVLELTLKSGSMEIKKTVLLAADYIYPENVAFEPLEGKVAIKGKEFKKEKTEQVVRETKKYFDKKYFYKKALPHLAAGVCVYALDSLVIRKKLNDADTSPGTKAFMNGLDKTSKAIAVGISLKGIVNIFRSFKKKEDVKVKHITHEDAIIHNRFLQAEIRRIKKDIFVVYKLKTIGSEN